MVNPSSSIFLALGKDVLDSLAFSPLLYTLYAHTSDNFQAWAIHGHQDS